MYLTRDDLEKHWAWLCRWRAPQEMADYIHSVEKTLGFDVFIQAGIDFLLEASIAAEFGLFRGADAVRLVADIAPDFELRIGDPDQELRADRGLPA